MLIISNDQIDHKIFLSKLPKKIISLVPSQTELLFDLGFKSKIVSITKFCKYPKEHCKKTATVGGTKKFNFELINGLKPDLIIANKKENYREGIEHLQNKYPVWTSAIFTLKNSFEMMKSIGKRDTGYS